MADKTYTVDLGEYGTLTGNLDQMDNMMRVLNQAGLYASIKMDIAVAEGNESTERYYKHSRDSTGEAHLNIWHVIKEDYMMEVSHEL